MTTIRTSSNGELNEFNNSYSHGPVEHDTKA